LEGAKAWYLTENDIFMITNEENVEFINKNYKFYLKKRISNMGQKITCCKNSDRDLERTIIKKGNKHQLHISIEEEEDL